MNELEPTSAAGYAAFLAKSDPPPEAIDDRTFTVSIPLPNPAIVSSTLAYILVDEDRVAHIVDPGWDSDENMATLRNALADWGLSRVGTVVATHLHPDHLGMADRVRREFGAELVISRLEWDAVQSVSFDGDRSAIFDEWGVPLDRRAPASAPRRYFDGWPEPEHLVGDGAVLDLGRPVRVVLTPGHSQGGITLVDEGRRRILTGDHVMPHINPGLGLGYVGEADPVADYLESAERLLEWDGYEVLPGHGYRFAQLGVRVRQHVAHHLRRTRQVAAVMERDPDATIWQIASQLHWSVGFDNLRTYFLSSALAQTAMHRRFLQDASRSARWLAPE